jgi:hypothetical protein
MDRTIWKEILQPASVQEINIPAGAELLCAREQREEICVWYRCDPSAPRESRSIAIVGTGGSAPNGESRYIGTASLHGGNFIFHVFEV